MSKRLQQLLDIDYKLSVDVMCKIFNRRRFFVKKFIDGDGRILISMSELKEFTEYILTDQLNKEFSRRLSKAEKRFRNRNI
jgi:hypothetical protein